MIASLMLLQNGAYRLFQPDQNQFGLGFVQNEGNCCSNGDCRAVISAHAIDGYFYGHCFDSTPKSNRIMGQNRLDSQ
jgi:hypothetical protein